MQVDHAVYYTYAKALHRNNIITGKDVKRICSSLSAKGVGFVIQLMSLRDDFLQGLKTGRFASSPTTRTAFRHSSTSSLPNFLRVMTGKVFDEKTGTIKPDACQATVREFLQLTSALKKMTPSGNRARTLSNEVWTKLVKHHNDSYAHRAEFYPLLHRRAELWKRVKDYMNMFLDRIPTVEEDPDSYPLVIPPGSNYEKLDSRFGSDWWTPCAFEAFGDPGLRPYAQRIARLLRRTPFGVEKQSADSPVVGSLHSRMRCSAQPKSYKAFRGVGVQAVFRMMCGLSWQRVFYKNLPDCMPLKDQSVMAENLLRNFWHIATIDLTSASDRVWHWMVEDMIKENKHYPFLKSIKTTLLELPGKKVFKNTAYLMGESITFPIISMFFASIAMAVSDVFFEGRLKHLIKIYGDDLQVPGEFYDQMIEALKMFGALPSEEKSFSFTSWFKESCEVHAMCTPATEPYNVRPSYLFTAFLRAAKDGKGLRLSHVDAIRLLDISKQSYANSKHFSDACASVVETYYWRRKLPVISEHCPDYGRIGPEPGFQSLVIQYARDELLEFTPRGLIRKLLRQIDQDCKIKNDYSEKKRRYIVMAKSGARLKLSDQVQAFELAIFHSVRPDLADKKHSQFIQLMELDPAFLQACLEKIENIILEHLTRPDVKR